MVKRFVDGFFYPEKCFNININSLKILLFKIIDMDRGFRKNIQDKKRKCEKSLSNLKNFLGHGTFIETFLLLYKFKEFLKRTNNHVI